MSVCEFVYLLASAHRSQMGHQITQSLTYLQLYTLQCRFWGSNSSPLQEHQMLLTTEPSLKLHKV